MREFAASVRTHISDGAYVDETYQLASVGTKTLARNSTTQFTIQGCDATSHFTADRRIRIVGATTDHGYVTSSSYSAPDTTVNVSMESGDVPSTPTQALVHVDAKVRSGAYAKTGSGNGLDADTVDGYQAASIFGPSIHAEALVNGSMLVWQRGSSSVSAAAGSETFLADRWYTNPSGAAVTVERTPTTPTGSVSPYAMKVTGATSVTAVTLCAQRIESMLIPYIKTTITVSALIKNDTGASLTPYLQLLTPSSADDFSSTGSVFLQPFSAISSGASQRVSYTIPISGYSNIDNGLEIRIQSTSGALNSAAKSITVTEVQIDRSTSFSFFRFRAFPEELLRCQRYYWKSFDYGTVPAQNWAGAGTGIPAGAIVLPGSSTSISGDESAISWTLPTAMRVAPTVTTFNPRDTNAEAIQIDGSGSVALTTTAGTSMLAVAANIGALSQADQALCFGATAVAEL